MVRFEVYLSKGNDFRWRLVAANNEIVATSEGYQTKQGALTSAKRIQQLAPIARIVEL
jgi:uncharacterized protein YegP (UPF0339 family)